MKIIITIRHIASVAATRSIEELGGKFKLKPQDLNFVGKYLYKTIGDNGWMRRA